MHLRPRGAGANSGAVRAAVRGQRVRARLVRALVPLDLPRQQLGLRVQQRALQAAGVPCDPRPRCRVLLVLDNGWIHSSGPCTDPACNCSCILNDTLPAGPTWYQDKADTWTRKIYAVFDAPHRGTPGTVHPAAAWPPLVENSAVYVAFNWTSKGGGAHGTADRIFVDTASCISATSPPRSNPCPAGETPTSKFGNAVPANASSAWVKVDGFPIIIGFEANPVGWGSTSYTIDSLSLQYTPVLATPAPPPSTPAPPVPTACPSVYTNDRSGTCYLHHATCGPLCDASHVRINANLTCPMYCPRCDCSACSSCPPPRGGTDCMTCLGGANCTVDNVMGCGCGHC